MATDPRRIQELFLKIIELPADERAAALNRDCAEDDELRARIEALLVAHDRPGSSLNIHDERFDATAASDAIFRNDPAGLPAHELDQSFDVVGPTTTVDDPRDATPGTDIGGRYKLLEKIGEGGMGEVWVAKQTTPVKRKVALKLVKAGMDSRAVLARFQQERQALAMMDHPNIARVLDAGMTSQDQPFFVMELVNGLALTKYCDEARLTPRERLELFIPICQAIQHAHQKGIVHRDLKPANILITLIDGKPVPKVIDFGVAKATAGKLTDETLSTGFGAVVGTLEYMSPEQAGFSNTDIDTRADIYSLGVILYELLTGLRPIDAGRLKRAAFAEMMRILQEEEPSTPSTRLSTDKSLPSLAALRQTEPKKLMSLLRGELDWVIMKCLEKSRDRRYETAGALSRDIQRYLKDEPVEARPASLAYRLGKFLKRHRASTVAASFVLSSLVAGFILATYGLVRARAEKVRADKARLEAVSQERLAVVNERKAAQNARRADDNAREAKLQLAEGLISQADALSLANRFVEAHRLYTDAYDRLAALNEPLTAARAGLWSSYQQSTFPLLNVAAADVFGVAIPPDGRTAVTGGWNTVTLWDLKTGRESRSFMGDTHQIVSIAIAPDGQTALTAGGEKGNELTLWDLVDGKEIRRISDHEFGLRSVAFTPDGRSALTGSLDKPLNPTALVKRWDLASGELLRTFTNAEAVTSIAIAPDGQTALLGCEHGTLKLLDVASGKELCTFTGHTDRVDSVVIASDGKTAFSGSQDLTFKQWNLASGELLHSFAGRSGMTSGLAIAPDGRTALSSDGSALKLWDITGDRDVRPITGQDTGIICAAIAPDGRTALCGSTHDSQMKLWDLSSGRELRTFADHAGFVNQNSVAFAPGGRTALTANADKSLKVWDLTSGEVVRNFTGHTDYVTCLAIAPDGRTALSGSMDTTVKLWDLASGNCLHTFSGHAAQVNSVAFTPDGKTALSGSWDGTLKQWEIASGRGLRSFVAHNGGVTCIAIAADGQSVLTGGTDGAGIMLKLWDLSSGKLIRPFRGHTAQVWSVAITPDGRTAYSASADKTLRL
jgi:WD40 repeat protein/serine/threonine protein kinase